MDMNRRQLQKIILSQWIIVEKQTTYHSSYALYAIDHKRRARLSWEGWNQLSDLLQFHIPVRCKAGSTQYSSQPCAKIAKKAMFLQLNEEQYEELEQLFYKPFSKKKWNTFIKEHL